jgi:hypothetical protein
LTTDEKISKYRHKICEKQGNMTPEKITNHTTEDQINSERDEISTCKLKTIRMTNDMKEDMQKQVDEIKEHNQVNESNDNAKKQLINSKRIQTTE